MEAHVYDNRDKFFNFQKLLIFGDKNVGKSSFLKRICKADFETKYIPSPFIKNIKLSFTEKDINFDFNIYEVDADEQYSSFYNSLLLSCHCILFFFDVTNLSSFDKIKEVIKRIEKKDKANKICKILVGNKIDQTETRQVTVDMIRDYLTSNESFLKYKDISVRTRDNLFDLLHSIFDAYRFKEVAADDSKDISVFESEISNKKNSLAVNSVYKIILLGDGTVGKSSFFKRYFYDDYDDNYMLTMGVNDKFKFIKIKENEIKLQLWDTAGQERFRSLPRRYYQHADGIILMYDVTNRESFNNVTKWMKDITENSKRKTIIYLVGNKIDIIDQKEVMFGDALDMAKQYNTNLFEISCKFDINVTEVLKKLSLEIYEKNSETNKPWNSSFAVDDKVKDKSQSCCSK